MIIYSSLNTHLWCKEASVAESLCQQYFQSYTPLLTWKINFIIKIDRFISAYEHTMVYIIIYMSTIKTNINAII